MVNLVTKILQSVYLCVITWFQILGKIQDGGQDGDPSTKGKIVSKYCNISKTPGRGYIHLPPPLYHAGGMKLRVRSRVNLKLQ